MLGIGLNLRRGAYYDNIVRIMMGRDLNERKVGANDSEGSLGIRECRRVQGTWLDQSRDVETG